MVPYIIIYTNTYKERYRLAGWRRQELQKSPAPPIPIPNSTSRWPHPSAYCRQRRTVNGNLGFEFESRGIDSIFINKSNAFEWKPSNQFRFSKSRYIFNNRCRMSHRSKNRSHRSNKTGPIDAKKSMKIDKSDDDTGDDIPKFQKLLEILIFLRPGVVKQ